ncbi:preprotein translocase subunit SecG [candidate division WOR-3 bacterium]|nr:preprotein translocase subunit SecG [candidate division WOR-3 bacterium]
MQIWVIALAILFFLLCVILAVIVLLQQRGKGGMAGVFGGGGGAGAEQIFGSSGVAPFMTKITAILGAVFMAFSLVFVMLTAPAGYSGGGKGQQTRQIGPPIPGQRIGSAQQTQEVEPEQGEASEQPTSDVVRQLLMDQDTSNGGQ